MAAEQPTFPDQSRRTEPSQKINDLIILGAALIRKDHSDLTLPEETLTYMDVLEAARKDLGSFCQTIELNRSDKAGLSENEAGSKRVIVFSFTRTGKENSIFAPRYSDACGSMLTNYREWMIVNRNGIFLARNVMDQVLSEEAEKEYMPSSSTVTAQEEIKRKRGIVQYYGGKRLTALRQLIASGEIPLVYPNDPFYVDKKVPADIGIQLKDVIGKFLPKEGEQTVEEDFLGNTNNLRILRVANPETLREFITESAEFGQRLSNLKKDGKQSDQKPYRVPLKGLTYVNYDGETVPAVVDSQVVVQNKIVHALDRFVQISLDKVRGVPSSGQELLAYFKGKFEEKSVIVGFSGYASDGFGYEAEVEAIREILSAREGFVGLVVDGGTSLGIPGISGLIAEYEGIERLGIVPLEGLRSLGRREATIVLGTQYGDEAKLIGKIPDILFILGGGPNSKKEYLEALNSGNTVVIVKLKEYPLDSLTNTFESLPQTEEALKKGQIIVASNFDLIKQINRRELLFGRKFLENRNRKIPEILGELASSTPSS